MARHRPLRLCQRDASVEEVEEEAEEEALGVGVVFVAKVRRAAVFAVRTGMACREVRVAIRATSVMANEGMGAK